MASKNVGSERKREPICAAKAHGTSQRAGGRIELDSHLWMPTMSNMLTFWVFEVLELKVS